MKYDSKSELEMVEIGRKLLKDYPNAKVIELIGDVGAGKTTLTKGIAAALGVVEPISSPSFTISNIYAGPQKNLIHYDFYRLSDPGIMLDELAEAMTDPDNIAVIEWGESVASLLPKMHLKVVISKNDDGSRVVEANLA